MSQALAATHVLSGAAVEVEYQVTNRPTNDGGLADYYNFAIGSDTAV